MPPRRKIRLRRIVSGMVILAWAGIFYLQFERSFIGALAQNLSPSFLFSFLRHQLFWMAWLTFPLLVLAWKHGRYFCWKLCPVGLVQDFLPAAGRSKLTSFNRALLIFLAGFSLFSLNLAAFLDPLVSFNRAVAATALRAGFAVTFLLPLALIFAASLWRRRWWCFKLCPLGAIVDWTYQRRRQRNDEPDIGRRRMLLLLGGGMAAGVARKALFPLLPPPAPRLIRPPGARPESGFLDRCIRCGSCLAICPTGGLQPSLAESGWSGIFTPRLVPRIGECAADCNRCGQSCPTQAIRYLPMAKKWNFKMGSARIDQETCIRCMLCVRSCPYDAIEARGGAARMIDEFCRGCGLCEKVCPVGPVAAIRVFNDGAGKFI